MKTFFTRNPFAGNKKSTLVALAVIIFVTAAVFAVAISSGPYTSQAVHTPTVTSTFLRLPADDDPGLGDDEWAQYAAELRVVWCYAP
jgi:hypothetical protein